MRGSLASRRGLLAGLAASLAFGVRAAVAQGAAPRTARVAWIGGAAGALPTPAYLDALRGGLRERGWVEGRNLVLEVLWGERDQAAALAQEVLRSGVDVIVAQGAMVLGVVRVSGTVPVVFGFSGDPVEAGLVASFARPGGSATGIAMQSLELVGKRLEYLKELVRGCSASASWPIRPIPASNWSCRPRRRQRNASA